MIGGILDAFMLRPRTHFTWWESCAHFTLFYWYGRGELLIGLALMTAMLAVSGIVRAIRKDWG